MDLENFPTNETAKDMMSMVSPIYDRSYVAKWIFEVMGQYLGLAQEAVHGLRNEAFPQTATWSLPYWEQAYGIETNERLSVDERRQALTSKRNYRRPMNPARIAQLVKEISGRDAELVENTAPHTFEIRIYPGTSEPELVKIIQTVTEVKQSQKHFQIVFETPITVRIRAEPVKQVFPYRMTSENSMTGRHPQESTVGKISRADVHVDTGSEQMVFPYILSGTRPDATGIGSVALLQVQASVFGEGAEFPYPMAGTEPETGNIGVVEAGGVSASMEGQAADIVYKMCGARKL